MILNVIIGAIAFIFSWAKVSKDAEEQTQLASVTKTIILAVLTFCVFVFYIKTYQVATITNIVDVNDYKYCADSTGKSIDTIKVIRITNQFSSGLTENREEKKVKKNDNERSSIVMGGIYIAQSWHNDNNNYKYNEDNLKAQGQDTVLGRFLDIPVNKIVHLYEVNTMRTSIPSMIPILPSFYNKVSVSDEKQGLKGLGVDGDFNSIKVDADTKVTHRHYDFDGNVEEAEGNEKALENAYVCSLFLLDTVNVDSTRTAYYNSYSNIANTFNFFTAADISQYSQAIDIKSNCYVEKVIFMYDIPIEINPYDSCMVTTSHAFSVRGKYLNDNIVKGEGDVFHVKLPTLENLQLIRSLILTTILTALVVLLLSNIFYLFRKVSLKYIELHKDQISEVRLRKFKMQIYILLSIFLAFLFYMACNIYNDESFHISMSCYEFLLQNYDLIILFFVIVILAVIYFLSRNVITKDKKKEKK